MTCRGKVPFGSKGAAKRAAKRATTRRGGRPLEAYRCDEHAAWHIGHPAPGDRVRERKVWPDVERCRYCAAPIRFGLRPEARIPIPVDAATGEPHRHSPSERACGLAQVR
jgi:hypothetical protein